MLLEHIYDGEESEEGCVGVEISSRESLEGKQVKSLSMMARVILIRSILNFIPTYCCPTPYPAIDLPCEAQAVIQQLLIWIASRLGGDAPSSLDIVCQLIADGDLVYNLC